MKPWKLVAKPHADVLSGRMKQSDFAADLSKVAAGTASPEYADAEKFFARTYLTKGLADLLRGVARRLAGAGGDPVLELQTNFGGGKTHTLLAVYHLASRRVPTERLAGVPALLDEAGIRDLPRARVAVFDGASATAAVPLETDGLSLRTVWGRLAHGLLGRAGYDLVAECDRTGTPPGKEIIDRLLAEAGPCAILLDELVAFYRQLGGPETLPVGTWGSNLTFLQSLMESVKASRQAVLVATIPASAAEAGDAFGGQVLDSLHTYFNRIGRPIAPVDSSEGCEIVRRRLFEPVEDDSEAAATCREFADLYRRDASFPPETRETVYEERMRACYPFHPEVFDRLYRDWATLPGFQRTRGVLQLLALVVRRLWNGEGREPLILPGSLPVGDPDLSAQMRGLLAGAAWGPVLDGEVDGPSAAPVRLDADEPVFGRIHAARAAARTIFLGTAPGAGGGARGLALPRVLLGCAAPGDPVRVYSDAVKKLRDRLHYLFAEEDRFWFDTRPNLRREMESRKARFPAADVDALVRRVFTERFGQSPAFAGFHPFVRSGDAPDDVAPGIRVVALPGSAAWTKAAEGNAFDAARDILLHHGTGARVHRNRLVFLAADLNAAGRVEDIARTVLAWRQISDDVSAGRLETTVTEKAQVDREKDGMLRSLSQTVAECWRLALVPRQVPPAEPTFDVRKLATQSGTIAQALETALRQNEDVVERWSPAFLKAHLEKYYFKGGKDAGGADEVSVGRVWNDLCNLCEPDFRRLRSMDVFEMTVREGLGLSDGLFGYAQAKTADGYEGFVFRQSVFSVYVNDSALFIRAPAAKAYAESRREPGPEPRPSVPEQQPLLPPDEPQKPAQPGAQAFRHYYANVALDPQLAVARVAQIQDELLRLFNAKPGVTVSVKLDIEASSATPFDPNLVRAVRENASPSNLNLPVSEFTE